MKVFECRKMCDKIRFLQALLTVFSVMLFGCDSGFQKAKTLRDMSSVGGLPDSSPLEVGVSATRSGAVGLAGRSESLCNIRNYGAIGDGRTDDTAAIQAAVAACNQHIYVPASAACYLFNGTLNFTGAIGSTNLNGSWQVVGDGPEASCIQNIASASPTIVGTNIGAGELNGVKLTHSNPSAGGDGIRINGGANWTNLFNSEFSNNSVGIAINGDAAFATIWNVKTTNNLSHGISITSGSVAQWQLFAVYTAMNGGSGIYVTGTGPVGEFVGLTSIYNNLHGVEINTPGVIGAIKLKSNLIQGNRGWGVHLDSGRGSTADIVNTVINGNGAGIYAGSMYNLSVSFSSISNNANHGAVVYADSWQLNGSVLNGNLGTGFYAGAGRGRIANVAATNNANYGVFVDPNAASASIAGVLGGGNGLGLSYPASSIGNTSVTSTLPSMIAAPSPGAVKNPPILPRSGLCNVREYGAVGDGVTDDTSAFMSAKSACGGRIYVPSSNGCYLLHETLYFSNQSFAVVGDQQVQSCIQNSTPNKPIILADNTTNGLIYGLHLTHLGAFNNGKNVPPTASEIAPGGDGIMATGTNSNLSIINMFVENSYIGLDLGNAVNSTLLNVVVYNNYSHGIAIGGNSPGWQATDLLPIGNNGDGLNVYASGYLGEINTIQSYGNQGHGIVLVGRDAPLYSNIYNCYVGGDKMLGFYIDSHGGVVNVVSCQLEGEPGGILATSSNAYVDLYAITANNNEGNAIQLYAQNWLVSGGNIFGTKGHAIVAGDGTGIVFNARASLSTGYSVWVSPGLSAIIEAIDDGQNGATVACGAGCINISPVP